MVLPSKEVMHDIRNLIYEVTGFGKDDENFYICEQYCLSHVMHHTYPSINKNEVKRLIDGYILRFFIHGYLRVADRLDAEVKKFLSSDLLFKKNPEFDIEWILLSLLTALASNLTAVSKLPEMTPVADKEKPIDEINWGEYLREGLPNYEYHHSDEDSDSDDLSFYSQNSEIFAEFDEKLEELDVENEKLNVKKEACVPKDTNTFRTFNPSRQHIIDELVKRREEEISYTRDIVLRGNFIEELGFFMNTAVVPETPRILSEFEVVGYVLKQFLTGENIFKRKGITNAATCSLTQGTLKSYLSTIQPYINMITIFKEFSNDVSCFDSGQPGARKDGSSDGKMKSEMHCNEGDAKFTRVYSNLNKSPATQKKSVPNVIKLYNLALTEALNPFENKILTMSEYQSSYTLVGVLNELRPSFNDLSSLFAVHLSATANWLNEPNWLCSVRIIMTLYRAILHSTSNRMGFLFMNMFLHCFQAYLDITDSWISCLTLNDPHEEYLIYRCKESDGTDGYRVRPYAEELPRVGIKEIPVLDILSNKMIHVGHSIDVLHRLDRSIIKDPNRSAFCTVHESLYQLLLRNVMEDIKSTFEALTLSLESSESGQSNGKEDCDKSNNNNNNKEKAGNNSEESDGQLNGEGSGTNTTCGNKAESGPPDRDACCSFKELAGKDVALGGFCMKLFANDKFSSIEKSIWPLGMMIATNTRSLLHERVLYTCDVAKDVVVNEFQLKIHISLLRNVFLFNDPHLIHPFMCAIFSQEHIWNNSYMLTAYLKECIEYRFRDQAEYLLVTVDDRQQKAPRNILAAIDGITINYQILWPLQLIFTPRVMSLYNDVFRNLLKLQWAHEALCKLQFNASEGDAPAVVRMSHRRLQLLRFWCLSSLARLRTYFMAQISIPFDLQLNSYQHLTHIIKSHEAFIKKIHFRCLLDGESTAERELIFVVLIKLCYDVYHFWCSGQVVPDSRLSQAESLCFKIQREFPRIMARLEQE